ncbi:Fungal specific transcription factor [Penicillium riverlandense]|uniref:Fungal specific transcription factor n=1 Tax=Penicillium riverlandense TaxID=1903569 RepID=UPI002546BCAE|nr:Fungal specific transcription factor [Penicillium riverlandense]KAJ5825316.1 Fungal specific transcription factor [Penicillium riverlandense]
MEAARRAVTAYTDLKTWSGVSLCLRRTIAILDYTVAAQAARILDLVDAARHGADIADEDYAVAIPYFGRTRINKKTVSPDNDNSWTSPLLAPSPVLPVDSLATLTHFNTVEFSTNTFTHEYPFKLNFETELFSADPALLCSEMDWTQTFTCGPFYPLDS